MSALRKSPRIRYERGSIETRRRLARSSVETFSSPLSAYPQEASTPTALQARLRDNSALLAFGRTCNTVRSARVRPRMTMPGSLINPSSGRLIPRLTWSSVQSRLLWPLFMAAFPRTSSPRASIDDQHRVCAEWCAREGFEIVARYEDQGISGAAAGNRPALFADGRGRRGAVVRCWSS